MFNVHIYDLKQKKKYNTPLNDPFNTICVIGRYEVYNSDGECILSSGKRRVKNIANYGNDNSQFLPLQILKNKYNIPNLDIISEPVAAKFSRYKDHFITTIAPRG